METEEMIPVSQFCIYHNIELSFIFSLKESGLIDVVNVNDEIFVPVIQLKQLETMMRLNKEMDINVEGIETITYLLQRINGLQQHVLELNNKLSFYENGWSGHSR